MRVSLKLVSFTLSFFSFCTPNIMGADKCPELNLKELRQLCRWEGFSKVPFVGIKAGFVKKGDVTLRNELHTCGEGDSLKQFFSQKKSTKYKGEFAKSFREPSNPLVGLCTYTLDGEKIGFEIDLPSRPTAVPVSPVPPRPTVPYKPKVVGGVDITMSPKIKDVIIKPSSTRSSGPPSRPPPLPPRQ